jgi:hypothetical protein
MITPRARTIVTRTQHRLMYFWKMIIVKNVYYIYIEIFWPSRLIELTPIRKIFVDENFEEDYIQV